MSTQPDLLGHEDTCVVADAEIATQAAALRRRVAARAEHNRSERNPRGRPTRVDRSDIRALLQFYAAQIENREKQP